MRALCWHGKNDVRVDTVRDPEIQEPATVKLATDRAHVIRQAIFCCRKGGTVSVPGVYVGLIDKMPFGAYLKEIGFRDQPICCVSYGSAIFS